MKRNYEYKLTYREKYDLGFYKYSAYDVWMMVGGTLATLGLWALAFR